MGPSQQPVVADPATLRTYATFCVRDSAYEPVLAALKAKIIDKYGTADERPSRHKVLYQDMRIGKGEWSRKFRGHTKFTYTEIEYLRRHFGAPSGWPFISWDLADANRRAHELLERTTAPRTAAPPGEPVVPTPAASSGHTERRRRGGRK